MRKMIAAGVAAICISAVPHAQARSAGAGERLTAADIGALTDARTLITG